MRKTTTLFVSSLLIAGVLVACNSEDDSNQEQPTTETDGSTEVDDNEPEDDQGTGDTGENEDNSEDEEDNTNDGTDDGVLADGDFDDQLDLTIGDTGNVETTLGKYSITLNEVEIVDELDGQIAELDYFVLVNYTLKNEGEEDLDAADAISVMEFTDDLEVSGFPDDSEYFDSVETIQGNLAPGEEVSGQAIYEAYEDEENYLRLTEGLVASGAAKNQLRFTFEKSEIE